jgi:outer membrane cobalamin receptor
LAKAVAFVFIIFFPVFNAFPQFAGPTDTASSDSAHSQREGESSDTLQKESSRMPLQGDPFHEEVFVRFSPAEEISLEDIDHSVKETVGDILCMWRLADLIKVGSTGQPEIAGVGGYTRGLELFVDGLSFGTTDLYLPQRGYVDLNTVLLSNVRNVRLLPGALAAMWGSALGIAGVDVVTKDFEREKPYSRATATRGPYGSHRSRAELGRGVTSRGRFYLTAEFRESDGYQTNSDYDGMSLSFKSSFELAPHADVSLSVYQYKTKMGIPPFSEASFADMRKAVNNWGIHGTVLLAHSGSAISKLRLYLDKGDQEIKSRSYASEVKKIENRLGLTATHTLRLKERHHIRIEGCGQTRKLEMLAGRQTALAAYVSAADMIRAASRLSLLLFARLGKEERLETDFSTSAGISYQAAKDVNLFWSVGRVVGYPALMDRYWQPFFLGVDDTLTEYAEAGNPNLKSQKSLLTDFGVHVKRSDYSISGYIFHSNIDDLTFWSNVDTALPYGYFKPVNTTAQIWGGNLNLRFRIIDQVGSYLSYSYKRGKDPNRDARLPNSPEHSFFGYVQWEEELLKKEIGLKLRLETSVLSGRFTDEHEQDMEPAVATLNAKLTIRFLDFHFHYLVRNITDQQYRLIDNHQMPGRTFWWGFYWEFFD